jgi:hypothetical protein
MKIRKKGYHWLLGLTILLTLSAIITLIPNAGASKDNLMGYRSICTGAPLSTLVLVLATGATCYLRKRYFTSK